MVGYEPIDVGSIPSFSTILVYLDMADFLQAYKITLGHEGGYTLQPNETYLGVDRKHHPKWQGWDVIDDMKRTNGFQVKHLDANHMLQNMVQSFYKSEFWDKMKLDNVNDQRIANELFDTGVNAGVGFAGKSLQRVLNVANKQGQYYPDLKVDGNVGNFTITALNKHPMPDNILKGLNALQGAKYIEICEANDKQEVFFNGWMKRVSF